MIYILCSLLVIVAFLGILNGFLRGASKARIDAFLNVLLIGLLIAIVVVGGWKAGLLAAVITFVAMIISRSLAARVAFKAFAKGSGTRGRYLGLPPRELEKISHQLANEATYPFNSRDLFSIKKSVGEDALLNYCESNATLQEVMNEFNLSREELRKLYYDMLSIGAGQWILGHYLAASALAYPDSLRYVVKSKKSGQLGLGTFARLVEHFESGAGFENLDDSNKIP